MLLSLLLFKEKITSKKVIALIFTIAGCVLVTGIAGGESIGVLGIVLGICSGLGYALYSIFSRYALQRNYNSMTISFYTFLFCGLACLPFSSPVNLVAGLTPKAVLLASGVGIICCVLPYLCFTKGLQYVENTKASIIVAVEPVIASFIGVIVYNEEMTVIKLAGVVLVLLAVVICSKD
jgi:drug/metabolite transporter (DMT)-like permease